jgi:hypothetical protein
MVIIYLRLIHTLVFNSFYIACVRTCTSTSFFFFFWESALPLAHSNKKKETKLNEMKNNHPAGPGPADAVAYGACRAARLLLLEVEARPTKTIGPESYLASPRSLCTQQNIEDFFISRRLSNSSSRCMSVSRPLWTLWLLSSRKEPTGRRRLWS